MIGPDRLGGEQRHTASARLPDWGGRANNPMPEAFSPAGAKLQELGLRPSGGSKPPARWICELLAASTVLSERELWLDHGLAGWAVRVIALTEDLQLGNRAVIRHYGVAAIRGQGEI